jgi:hypothetical protein
MIIGTLVRARRVLDWGLRGSREEREVEDMARQARGVRLRPDERNREGRGRGSGERSQIRTVRNLQSEKPVVWTDKSERSSLTVQVLVSLPVKPLHVPGTSTAKPPRSAA